MVTCLFKSKVKNNSDSYPRPAPMSLAKLFGSSVLIGLAIWIFWPLVTGLEVWDAGPGFFPAIGAAGFLFGWIGGKRAWLPAVGISLGPLLLSLPSLLKEMTGRSEDWLGFGYAFFYAEILILVYTFLAAYLGAWIGIQGKALTRRIRK